MARNGSGTYTLPAGNPVVTGTTISSTWANNTLNDIGTAITGSIAADGQTPIIANLPMNNFRHTGVGNATAQGQYASVSQVQNGAFNYLTGASGTDTITANSSISPAAYADGQKFTFVPAGTNTGATTLNVNGLGAIDILRQDGSATQAGDIASGDPVTVEYISGDFYISNSNLESFGLKNKAILKDSSNITATAGGTADAITATFSPAISAISDSLCLQINGLSPNTITNPTLDVGTGALTVVDQNLNPIEPGDIPQIAFFKFKTGSPNKAVLVNKSERARVRFVICSTASATAAKSITISGYTPIDGDELFVNFTNKNSADVPTFTINSTSYPIIMPNGSAPSATQPLYSPAGLSCRFIYKQGSGFQAIIETIKTYVNGTQKYSLRSDGYIFQYGNATGITNNSTQTANLTLLVEMKDTNYTGNVCAADNTASANETATTYFHPISVTTVAIGSGWAAGRPVYWSCEGYSAI